MGWRKSLVFAITMAVGVLGLSGCGGSSSSSLAPDPMVRFLNASPDTVALDFNLDDSLRGDNVAYKGFTTPFFAIEPREWDVNVKENGAVEDLDTAVNNFVRDRKTVILTAGLKNFGTEFDKRIRLNFIDVDTRAPNDGKARLVIVHGFLRATGFATPDIDFASPGDTPLYVRGDIKFGQSGTLDVDAGSLTFDVKRANSDQVYVSTTQTFASGKVYLVLVSGIQGQAGAQAPSVTSYLLN